MAGPEGGDAGAVADIPKAPSAAHLHAIAAARGLLGLGGLGGGASWRGSTRRLRRGGWLRGADRALGCGPAGDRVRMMMARCKAYWVACAGRASAGGARARMHGFGEQHFCGLYNKVSKPVS